MTIAISASHEAPRRGKQRKAATAKVNQERQEGKSASVVVADIRIDSTYQRGVDARRVSLIAADWDQQLAGALVVNVRGGVMWCIDGQHRLAALRELGLSHANAVVFEGLSQVEEAALFIKYNKTQKALRAWDWFTAELVARNPDALAIKSAVQRAGFELAREASGTNAIEAVSSMKRIYRLGGDELIASTLDLVSRCWMGLKKNRTSNVLEGIAIFVYGMHPEPNWDSARVNLVLERLGPVRLIQEAGEVAANENKASVNANVVAQTLVNKFNQGLGRGNRLPKYIKVPKSPR